MSLAIADQKVHPVESQWHYPILTEFGYEPLDKEGVGLVRSYKYQKGDHVITVTTGANADYWEANDGFGYWADLKPYLQKLP